MRGGAPSTNSQILHNLPAIHLTILRRIKTITKSISGAGEHLLFSSTPLRLRLEGLHRENIASLKAALLLRLLVLCGHWVGRMADKQEVMPPNEALQFASLLGELYSEHHIMLLHRNRELRVHVLRKARRRAA